MAKGKGKGKGRWERAGLMALLGGAFLLRLMGIQWGLPDERHYFPYHPDESTIVLIASQMASSGDWNPHFFNYGSLPLYLTAFLLRGAEAMGLLSLQEPHWAMAYLLARLWVALLGTATVGVLYLLGRELGGPAVGWGAAGWLAVMPLHVVHSHYATVDVPLTFLLLMALWMLMGYLKSPHPLRAAGVGLFLGLGTATKYNAAVLWLVMAPCLGWPWRRVRCWNAASLAFGGAFLLACPYALLDMGTFARDLHFELRHARYGGTLDFVGTPPGWIYHLTVGFPTGLGLWGTFLGLAGILWMASHGEPKRWALAGAFLVQYLLIGSSAEKFIRYLMPLLPLMALGGAEGTWRGWGLPGLRPWAWALGGAVVAGNLAMSLAYDALLAGRDVRDQAADWAWQHIPPGSLVGLTEEPYFFTPPLWPYNGGLKSRQWLFAEQDKFRYRFIITGWVEERLRRNAPEWFLISEFEYAPRLRLGNEGMMRFWRALEEDYELVWRAKTWPCLGPLCFRRSQVPHDWRYPNPEIRIYRRRSPTGQGFERLPKGTQV